MNNYYVSPYTHGSLHIGVSKQTSLLREHAKQHDLAFSLPIVEWAIPGVYYRLFEIIVLAPNGVIYILRRDMLPSNATGLWTLLAEYLFKYNVRIVSLGFDEDDSVYLPVEGWTIRPDGSYELHKLMTS